MHLVEEFDFGTAVWLNAAHQGPLPRVAAEAAADATRLKVSPWSIGDGFFSEIPSRLRAAISRLIHGDPEDVIVGNSASYGLDLLARGLAWKHGDEVLFVDGEFPANVFPWLIARNCGVQVRSFRAGEGNIPSADEMAANISPQTRVFVCSWVNSFSGYTLDIAAVSRACRKAGVLFVLNASQGLGARVLSVADGAIDVLTSCGYKWLLGPYGTGFCWMSGALRRQLRAPHTYWLPNIWGYASGMESYSLRDDLDARAFDVFAPAAFQSTMPWTASIDLILRVGAEQIEQHNKELVENFIGALDEAKYELLSPETGSRQSAILVVRHRYLEGKTVWLQDQLASRGIYAAVRNEALRLSPHLYNSTQDMLRTATILNELR